MSYEGERAVALVSGGLDSIVSLSKAAQTMDVRLALFIDYGQRAAARERHAVMGAVNYYGLPFREVSLEWLGRLAPEGMRRSGTAETPPLDTLDAVWIPNRNGVFLNVAAAYAERYGCAFVVTGFNREEAEEFPDNSAEYVTRTNAAFELSTRGRVRVMSFTLDLDKREILELGVETGAPLSVVWSCYHERELMCGVCGSCRRLKTALAAVAPDDRPPIRFEGDTS